MNSIIVSGPDASLIEEAIGIVALKTAGESLPNTRTVPHWNADGTEVSNVGQVAAVMGVKADVAAHYALESKSASPELVVDAMTHLELKVIRHVRTPAGKKRYGQPIGSIIVRDGASPLKNLTSLTPEYDGAETVKGADGKKYHVTKDPDTNEWVALGDKGMWDDVAASSKTEAGVYQALDKKVGGTDKPSMRGGAAARPGGGALRGHESRPTKPAKNRDELIQQLRDQGLTAADARNEADDILRNHGQAGSFDPQRDMPSDSLDPANLKRSGMPTAGTVKPGDIVAPPWAEDFPGRVERVGKITPKGRITVYYENGNQQTYKFDQRLIGFIPKEGGSPKGGDVTAATLKGAKPGDKVTISVPGQGGINHHIFTKGTDGRWHKGTADTKGSADSTIIKEFAKVQKSHGATIKMGDAPGPFSSGQTLPGGDTAPKHGAPPAPDVKHGASIVDKGYDSDATWEDYFKKMSHDDVAAAHAYLKTPKADEMGEDPEALKAAKKVLDEKRKIMSNADQSAAAKVRAQQIRDRATARNAQNSIPDVSKAKFYTSTAAGKNEAQYAAEVASDSGRDPGFRIEGNQIVVYNPDDALHALEGIHDIHVDNSTDASTAGEKRSASAKAKALKELMDKIKSDAAVQKEADKFNAAINKPENAAKLNEALGKGKVDKDGNALKPELVTTASDNKPDGEHHKFNEGSKYVTVGKSDGKWWTRYSDHRAGSASGLRQSVRWFNSEDDALKHAGTMVDTSAPRVGKTKVEKKPTFDEASKEVRDARAALGAARRKHNDDSPEVRAANQRYKRAMRAQNEAGAQIDGRAAAASTPSTANTKEPKSIARTAVAMSREVDAFNFTRERQKRLEDDYNRWVENATPQELIMLRAELLRMSSSGALTAREKAAAKTKADQLTKKMKGYS